MNPSTRLLLLSSALATSFPARALADDVILKASSAATGEPVFAQADLRAAGLADPSAPAEIEARVAGRIVPAQYVPAAPGQRTGTIVLRWPGETQPVSLHPRPGAPAGTTFPRTVRGPGYSVTFDPAAMGGMPSRFDFDGSAPAFTGFAWNDRLHSAMRGGYLLRNDRQAQVAVVSDGPLCTVVRVTARYLSPSGAAASSGASAVYDWYIFHDRPLIRVSAYVRQSQPAAWDELHFLELNWPDGRFPRWSAGEPARTGAFTGAKKGDAFSDWVAATDGRTSISLISSPARMYDGRGEYGCYLHGPWEPWSGTSRGFTAWLRIAADDAPAEEMRRLAHRASRPAVAFVSDARTEARLAALRARSTSPRARWLASMAERMQMTGRRDDLERLLLGQLPAGWSLQLAGGLGLAVERAKGGIRLASLFDLGQARELLAPVSPPLFELRLQDTSGAERSITSDSGWRSATVASGQRVEMRWSDPDEPALAGLAVTAVALPNSAVHAWAWTLKVHTPRRLSVMTALFPQVALADPGPGASALYPGGPGVLYPDAWSRPVSQRSMYPNGWCAMQFMAAYGARGGLYFALHDLLGGAKELVMQSEPAERSLRMSFDVPAPDRTRDGNGFTSPGPAVMRLMRGDWFDAARIYRAWVTKEARWWPKLGPDGREDTPKWMRELSAWAQTGGAPAECVESVKKMQRALGVPIGFHWYNWHAIPFDNDYPHYLPTKPGVTEAIRDLQASGVFVMPYINGRLWDTHDRGSEDWQFTSLALPAATKQADGKPFIESYGSRETDGSPVRLAPMCPTTPLWQETVREIVLRIMNEVGAKAVYIDQIAAASPALCMDPAHGHPLGGGHWWTEAGYWPLLARLRAAMPAGHMITTECNAEPYIRWMDGYLTWHWQMDNMVPAFPAVYGGAVQMFSRAYNAGAGTRDLALCQKMGQELVFGEQIGWLSPSIALEPVAGGFLRQTVRTRARFTRYFYAGEMARPPKLTGSVPSVRADWAWSGETWVTTPAVLTGAWRIPRERRALFLFTNVSASAVDCATALTLAGYGIPAQGTRWTHISDADAKPIAGPAPGRLSLPPRSVIAYEARW